MHRLLCVVAVVFTILLAAPAPVVAQMPANELEGTWRMVSQKRIYADSTVDYTDQWGPSYKILNSTHFAWGRETKDGETVLAGGGQYEYHPEKNLYVEHIQYHSEPAFSGMTLRFEARIEGDTWYHVGDVGDYKLREVWKRVDPQEVRRQLAGRDSASASPPRTTDGGSP